MTHETAPAGVVQKPKRAARKGTKTSSFGVSYREAHDSQAFYARQMLADSLPRLEVAGLETRRPGATSMPAEPAAALPLPPDGWVDQIYLHSAENMLHVPDHSVGLAFTSPPYNAGKDYDQNDSLVDYLALISNVAAEVYRVLVPGGRYVVNIANLGRKPYVPLTAYFYASHLGVGFLPAGEVVWQKARGASGSCAWGSWLSAKAPRLRDLHETLLVFVKDSYARPDKGQSTLSRDEFMESTLSIWEIPPESARAVGHPAPFPLALARRVINLWSYADDVVLDPFCGSGTTCVAAVQGGRKFVGYDIVADYVELSRRRLGPSLRLKI